MTTTRFNYAQAAPGVYDAMDALDTYLQSSGLDRGLLMLVQLQRLCSLDAWSECPYYSDRERAALAWTEAVTLVAGSRVPDAVYELARGHFGKKELADLTLAIATINAWNRLSIAARLRPGTYEPQKATA
jgi:hypothetical protein